MCVWGGVGECVCARVRKCACVFECGCCWLVVPPRQCFNIAMSVMVCECVTCMCVYAFVFVCVCVCVVGCVCGGVKVLLKCGALAVQCFNDAEFYV